MASKHVGTWYEQSAYKRGRKVGFGVGKKVGMWLAYNEPWKAAEQDEKDKEVVRQSRERAEPEDGKYDAYAEQPERASSSSSSSSSVFETPRAVSPPADYSPRAVSPPADYSPRAISPVRAAQPAVSAESDVFAEPIAREDVRPEKPVVPELPLDQYAPDGYNEYTTKQLRDRIAELIRLGKESELNKLLRVVANRRKQDVAAMKKAIRKRERQDLIAARQRHREEWPDLPKRLQSKPGDQLDKGGKSHRTFIKQSTITGTIASQQKKAKIRQEQLRIINLLPEEKRAKALRIYNKLGDNMYLVGASWDSWISRF